MPVGDFVAHQEVLDAALRLLACRIQALEVVDVAGSGAEIVASDGELARWTIRQSQRWSHLLSTTPAASASELARSLSNNRAMVERGLRMKSVFDLGGTEAAVWGLLAAEPGSQDIYFASFAPVLMRIVDYRFVLMSGPVGTRSILRLSSPTAVEAALGYWRAVAAHARPCRDLDGAGEPSRPTVRQTLILELLRRGDTDTQIGSLLSISTRTVQSEVAALMARYGAGSRFALGFAYALDSHRGPAADR
ncbi:helix-turn-helix transcriptional regulator [Nocardioides sp. R1-1]|uniref:helix-turn-helix transcriptional regulator n=1 Tax=Nocardioides sp. R1-1 TaxID=3383502 RepID=UPI0038D2384E